MRPTMRARLGYREGDKVVIFVANELHRKGFEPLIRALAGLGREVKLLAVGKLDPRVFKRLSEELELKERIRFVGPSDCVSEYYAAADLFALPTQYEAWGLVIVEAMACGLPVLTSRCAGAAVAVVEGRNGFLLDDPWDVLEIREKLGRLLGGSHEADEVIGESVSEFAWDIVLKHYEQVLLETFASPVCTSARL
jgi:UDP-glucose:(heptosyl)LPS alpha-1,3-glucosyltransferase